uniref:Uncharacterized protein n=1 Tax=Oryza punctata TaxID=4537 RepID=A0A0E0M3E9_ORYPU
MNPGCNQLRTIRLINYHHAPRSNRLGLAGRACTENAEEECSGVSFGSDRDDRGGAAAGEDGHGGENGGDGDGDGDGVNVYLRFPGPTLTGSGDGGVVVGEVDGDATLLLMCSLLRPWPPPPKHPRRARGGRHHHPARGHALATPTPIHHLAAPRARDTALATASRPAARASRPRRATRPRSPPTPSSRSPADTAAVVNR